MPTLAAQFNDVHRFLRAVATSNPFLRNRVTQPTESEVDVSTIHEAQFKKLTRYADAVRSEGAAVGTLLVGSAGVGKSHVLARMFRWAAEEGRATVVYLHNVLASPLRLPRYLLHATLSDLTGHKASEYPQSRLYYLLNRAIVAELGARRSKAAPSLEARRRALEAVGHRIDPENAVMSVLIAFLEGAVEASQGAPLAERRARAAVQWLSGELVERELGEMLGLSSPSDEGSELPDDAGVATAFGVLARLSACDGRPFILCVDQVDNLDPEQVTSLTAFLHALLDRSENLMVVVSGVKDTMNRFQREGVIAQAAWDRLAQYRVELSKVSTEEGRRIVQDRIARFMQPFRELEEVRPLRASDPLFPLDQAWLTELLSEFVEVRPRDVINWSRERWEDEQDDLARLGDTAWLENRKAPRHVEPTPAPESRQGRLPLTELIDEQVKKKVSEAHSERRLHPDRLPPNADNLATLTSTLLLRCVGDERYTLRSVTRHLHKRRVPIYDLTATEQRSDGQSVGNGIVFVASESTQKGFHALQRMLADDDPPDHQLLVTDEERRPLKLGPSGKTQLEQLMASERFRHVKLSFDDYASLDALANVIATARVGDLEVEYPRGTPREVTEAECVESLHRQGLFVRHPFLRELLTEDAPGRVSLPIEPATPDPQRARELIMAELSWRMGLTTREVTTIFLQREKVDGDSFDFMWVFIKNVAQAMHAQGLIHATAQDDDFFLLYKKQS